MESRIAEVGNRFATMSDVEKINIRNRMQMMMITVEIEMIKVGERKRMNKRRVWIV